MKRSWALILVGLSLSLPPLPSAAQGTPQSPTTLDLNTATREQLLSFPGIGQAYADKIIAGRPFKMRSELVGRHLMPAANYLKIKKSLLPTAEDAAAEAAMEAANRAPAPSKRDANGRLNVNVATREELVAIEGIGAAYADKIIAGRPYQSLNELVSRNVLSEALYAKVRSKIFAR